MDFLSELKDNLLQVITDRLPDLSCNERLDLLNALIDDLERYRADLLGTIAGVRNGT